MLDLSVYILDLGVLRCYKADEKAFRVETENKTLL